MVDECSRGVECSEHDKAVRKELVHLFHGTRKCTISRPRGSDLKETEDRQGIAACEMENNAHNPDSSQEDVESVVSDAACRIAPYPQQRALGRRWWIAESPRGSRAKQHENRYSSGYVHEYAD